MSEDREHSTSAGRDWFVTTHWSVVRAAADGGASADASVALEKLCANYWQSLYFYVRRKGHDEQEAQDLTQEFFSRLLARNDFAGLDPRQGRFRAFLLAAMNHFLANEWRRAATLKRGGGEANLAFDTVIAEQVYATQPAADSSAEKLFDRQWAEAVLTRSAQALRQEFTDAGRSSLFAELNVF
jgi:RNA polymerase sigma-70 factor (ECF subfamily)